MLKPNDEFLFTRQRHEAERMGLHYDYRLVHGDKAYSFATKKEMPEPGKMILLFEQPVHDRHYALSDKVVIPSGQYGAGVTYLDMIHKARIDEHSTDDKIVIHTKNGGRFLLKKMPVDNKYGEKAWLFKNLGTHDVNVYLNKARDMEKQSSLIAAGIGAHFAQNLGTHFAIKSPKVSKYIADSFRAGAHGVANDTRGSKLRRAGLGAILPDVAVAHKSANDAGRLLKPVLDKASPRQKAGLRMLSQGRIDDLKKYNLHNDPVIHQAHRRASKMFPGIPSMESMLSKSKETRELFKSKDHPLLSNIVSGISRGEAPKGAGYSTKRMTAAPSIGGALATMGVEPATGALNLAKSTLSSKAVSETKYGKKLSDALHKQFIESPIKAGLKQGSGFKNDWKHKAYHFGVNPMSANLKRTSAALADVSNTNASRKLARSPLAP